MKTLSKNFDKSKTYIKNNLSNKEIDKASEVFLNSKNYLTLEQIFDIEKKKKRSLEKH